MSSRETKDRLRKLTIFDGNTSCADCMAPRPTWTSLIVLPEREEPVEHESVPKMLGVFICFRCSGVQRGIGSKFCSVKMMAMDKWTEEELKAIELGGNNVVNSVYEAKEVTGRPEPRALMNPRKAFLKEKYVERKFLDMDKLEEVLQWISLSEAREKEKEKETKLAEMKQEEGKRSDGPNSSGIDSSLHFDDGKLFPSPQFTQTKTAAPLATLDSADEEQESEFPEDFPNFPDFDSSRPDLSKEISQVGEFGDVRKSFLASVPETMLAGSAETMSLDDFSADTFGDEDGLSSKPQAPIAFEDLFTEDDESVEDDFGEAVDFSFVSPKPKALEESNKSQVGAAADSSFVADALLPQIPIESEEPKPEQDDDSSSHSSHISHSSHSSHSSAEEELRETYDTSGPDSQDPFGEELAFPEEPLPPANDILQSLDEPFTTHASDTQQTTNTDKGEIDADFPSMEAGSEANGPDSQTPIDAETSSSGDPIPSLQTPSQPLQPSSKADPFDRQNTSSTDPFSFDTTGKTQSLKTAEANAFGGQDSAFADPFSFDGADHTFPGSTNFGAQTAASMDPFAFGDEPSKSFDDAFGGDAFGDDAFGDQDADPFAADGDSDDFSASLSRDEGFKDFSNVDNSFRSDLRAPSERLGSNTTDKSFDGDSFSNSDRVGRTPGHTPFHVTPSNRRRSSSVDKSFDEEEPKKKRPPSLDSAFKKMSQADATTRSDCASTASSSSRPSVMSVKTAPTRHRSRSADRDDLSTPNSHGSKGKRHTMSIGTRSFNSSQQRRKPKPRQTREGSLDRGASWGNTLPEDDDANDALPPRATSMDDRLFGFEDDDDSDDGFGQSLSHNQRAESRFGGSRMGRQPGSQRAQKPTRSLSPFMEFSRATKGKSNESDNEPSPHEDEDVGFKHSFRPPKRTRSLNVEEAMKPSTRGMPARDEQDIASRDQSPFSRATAAKQIRKPSSMERIGDDGFSNPNTPRVTMAGWSAGNISDVESTASSHSNMSYKMPVVTEENNPVSFTHVADELSASFDKDDFPAPRRASGDSGPKRRNHLVRIESARSKVRRKEEALAGLIQDTERRQSLQSTPSLRMKLEADEDMFERHASSVDGGLEKYERQESGDTPKRKFVLFPSKTNNTPEKSETR
ncbi:unnamed protein product [Cylindrotheca closterium]|uniref:Arf-GAP domain-containing protein n=1 Tax=Cylindrotheca closterium TaxID=2856 RepID=A0AAD2CCA7_9STRA|nr:unnamed protein product [Cylindrotheca closterium]